MYDPCMECWGAVGTLYITRDGRVDFTSHCGIGSRESMHVPDGATVLGEEYEPCRNFSSDKWRKIALDRGLL